MMENKQKEERLYVFEFDDGLEIQRGDGSVFIARDELQLLADGIQEYLEENDDYDEEAELVPAD